MRSPSFIKLFFDRIEIIGRRHSSNTVLFVAALIFTMLSGCSSPFDTPSKTFNHYVELAKQGDQEKLMECYTEHTKKLLHELEKESAEFKDQSQKKDMSDQFKDTKTEIISQKIDGDRATLKVSVDKEEIELLFLKESGKWKIDMSAQLEIALKGIRKLKAMKGGMKSFLKQFKSNMKEE